MSSPRTCLRRRRAIQNSYPRGQVNLFGVLVLLAGIEEGVELNLLGLTFGAEPNDVALELPLVGTLGFGGRSPLQRGTDDEYPLAP